MVGHSRYGLALVAVALVACVAAPAALAMPPEVKAQAPGNCTTYGDFCVDDAPGGTTGSDASTMGPNDGSGWGAGSSSVSVPGSGGGLNNYGAGAAPTTIDGSNPPPNWRCGYGSSFPSGNQTAYYCQPPAGGPKWECTDTTPWWHFWGKTWECKKP